MKKAPSLRFYNNMIVKDKRAEEMMKWSAIEEKRNEKKVLSTKICIIYLIVINKNQY